MATQTDTKRNFSYYTWPLIVTGMLLSVIIAGIYTISLAISTPAQLVESSPYEKGLHFDSTLKERTRANKEDIVREHSLYRTKDGSLTFQVTISQESDMSGSSVKAHFMRPSDKELDFDVDMLPGNTDHTYKATLPVDERGLWHVEVKITDSNKQISSYRYKVTSP